MNNEFPKVTENLALNFLNTRIVRKGKVVELLNTPKDLQRWVTSESAEEKCALQLNYLTSFFETIRDMSEILAFRKLVYTQIDNTFEKNDSFISLKKWIKTELEKQAFLVKFSDTNKVFVPKQKNLEGFKTLIFLHLSELIETQQIEKLSHCENSDCVLLFINTSGRRKWCSMKICGNRNKVERFEKKHK